MSGGLENIREQMVDYLKEQGVQAFAAWPAGERPVQEGALVVVSLRGCQAGPAGFQHYLGGAVRPKGCPDIWTGLVRPSGTGGCWHSDGL